MVVKGRYSTTRYGQIRSRRYLRSAFLCDESFIVNGTAYSVSCGISLAGFNPVVVYGDYTFVLGWDSIIKLAIDAGLIERADCFKSLSEVPNE